MSGIFFIENEPETCCLCGAREKLTGEHKLKRSAISAEFGKADMVIGSFGSESSGYRRAQGPKSKAFHFQSKLCASCNGDRTQEADREFDRLHSSARDLLDRGENPADAISATSYVVNSQEYLNVFRYFAKLLCCHLAEVGAPRPVHMSNFALGKNDRNCIWLSVDRDPTFKEMTSSLDLPAQYAAHGGLIVYGDKKTGSANGFHSSLTFGPIRYVFFNRLTWLERYALRFGHRDFDSWCKAQVLQATSDPISDAERNRLGL